MAGWKDERMGDDRMKDSLFNNYLFLVITQKRPIDLPVLTRSGRQLKQTLSLIVLLIVLISYFLFDNCTRYI